MQSSSRRSPLPSADDGPARAELTPVVPSFSGVDARATPQERLESLERYRLLARLGQGGMAEVFLAAWEVAPFVHRPVVIKRLHPHFNDEPRLVEMFLDEARLLTRLDHPNIVKTLEAGVIDGRCCIAMEYLEGQPLQRVLRRANECGGLTAHVAVSIAISVLDGLHYSHEIKDSQGQPLEIVHRDVSPQNVFVSNEGQVKVLDYGIAKAKSQEGHTATGIVKGKVGYIAPEQARAERVDRRADVWSAGVVLWEALTGARLFKADTDAATLGLTLQGQIPSARARRPDIPEQLEMVLARALQRDPMLRYQTAGAMRQELEAWLARAGYSRDARVIGGLMKALFASEIVEQQRLVSVLMARSDCTPPAPASNRSPSSTSALYVKVPQGGATSADLTRMNDQMEALGKRHRRAFRSMFALLGALSLLACMTIFLAMTRTGSGPIRTTQASAAVAAAVAAHPSAGPGSERAAAVDDESRARPAEPAALAAQPTPSAAKAPRALPPARSAKAQTPPPATASASSAPKPELAASFGFLTIDTSPWSMVSVGGRLLGQTPLIGVKLPSGSQVLSLANPEQGIETSYPVTIESGKTTVRRIGIE